ncbi:TadE/TadG family type IV pilus assembly protein [Hyphomonas sp. UBA4494]|jgi:Flp pilus assembly protein TadG|uniref:TadE/TadG family type IV pilus assembly protein n=1 Tax=Hyphomonas sp. UBA4494 TaxID=1946631 RepID=UPI0025BC11BD|nr:TadE/TadG family type IV pilus assembly protein [Hyphomonas sp. UBA4494]
MKTLKSSIQDLLGNCTGATAVEFAMVAPLIFAAIFGTFEAGLALYERNRLQGACSAGAREILIAGASDDNAIEAAIRAQYKNPQQQDLSVVLATKTVSGEDFKEIQISYYHELIVGFGNALDGFTFTSTCYGRGV